MANSLIDRAALQTALAAQGEAFQNSLTLNHANLFSDVAILVTSENVRQMRSVIEAVEAVLKFSGGNDHSFGVFYGYDFHINAQGAHLIEINTNAGGAFLNALLIDSQRASSLPGKSMSAANLGQELVEMFRNEWRLVRGEAPLKTIAIVDEQPEQQFLYPEFLLAKNLFEQAGISTYIVDPSVLKTREDALHVNGQKIDLIYNRLTDFDLPEYPQLRAAWEKQQIVLTPNPSHYYRYADKNKLVMLTDSDGLRAKGVAQASIDELIRGIPQTMLVKKIDAEQWWTERKQWFFKPVNGHGSKGVYRGDKITKRVFEEIVNGDYVAQRLAVPGECSVTLNDGEIVPLKYDVRCYVYEGKIQLVAARLYQGQTTNFRTPHGGFALVHMVE